MIKRSSGQKAEVRVYSDSVLCVGQMNESKETITRWEGQVEEFKMCPSYEELLERRRDWNDEKLHCPEGQVMRQNEVAVEVTEMKQELRSL